jgi:hypothetical protein
MTRRGERQRGTLGGLVSLGRLAELGRLLEQALIRTRLRSSDPHCSDHRPGERTDDLHAGAPFSMSWPTTPCTTRAEPRPRRALSGGFRADFDDRLKGR